ncbi:AAA family ATPase [Nonomuraea sp. NN258]|uniref:helix-turn-helix transcriptional regulator n=1 Tax=Nonomuraea antri TaxID=2730852 RepID=UPI0015687DF0|nr:LuxR family transcriptional regulator [Nonomuraea antri]NRQ36588.1 AAA family ATPase [Nonomuraea antri]
MLYGRDAEQTALTGLITGARDGRSGALVVRGEAGIGKTALLDWAAGTAGGHGLRVLRVTGIEPEADLAFGALTQLLWPLQDRLDELPEPQAEALKAVFGSGLSRDRFLIGLAVLTLLADLAERAPVLCLVDDAQWLDLASAEALLFAARRLAAEGVAMVFAAREDGFAASGLAELRPSRLDRRDAGRLLAGREVPPPVREQVIDESAGNPLALIEFAATRCDQRTGPHLRVADRVLSSFRAQIARLPERTRLMLLIAAAEGRGDLALQLRAAQRLDVGLDDLEAAERAGLIQSTETSVAFRHPLVATAAYQGATLARRVTVHGALADSARSADCRTRHLPAATMEPDADVAAELAAAAERAHGRTAYQAACQLYAQAARLATAGQDQTGWLARAAAAALAAGNPGQAARLAEQAEDLAAQLAPQPDAPGAEAVGWQVAQVVAVRANAMFEQGEEGEAIRLLQERARTVPPEQGAAMLRTSATYAWFTGDEHAVHTAARELAALGHPDPMAEGLAQLMRDDYDRALPLLVGFVTDATGPDATEPDATRPDAAGPDATGPKHANDADDAERALYTALIIGADATLGLATAEAARLREQGLIGALPPVLQVLAQAQFWAGRHAEAEASAAAAAEIAGTTGLQQHLAWFNAVPARIAAIEGDESRARHLAGSAPPAYRSTGAAVLALLELSSGDYASALDRLESAWSDQGRNATALMAAAPDQVEAAVRLGWPHRAEEPLRRLRDRARASGQPWARALALRAQALIDDDERSYQQALRLHETSGCPFEQARTRLLYGEWLRRDRRPAEARAPLHAALETFARLRATPWADRARAELRAAGDTPPAGPAGGTGQTPPLTPQELQVVRLAATGRSSREIAAQLFLSPRTVEYHLYKAYPKLGVSSRRELAGLDLG